MEGELFAALYAMVREEAKLRSRRKRVRYSDALIVLVYFWAVLHDRPIRWACAGLNWPGEMAWLCLPSAPTMSRRLATFSCWMLIIALCDRLRALAVKGPGVCLCRRIDTKPLVVGGFSKDRDAARGYATGGLARGYKLAAAWGGSVVPDAWVVASLKVSDQQSAMAVIDRLVQSDGAAAGYLLADSTHDTNPLHAYAAARRFQLLTPRKKPGTALGHRDPCPSRLRSIELLEGPGRFGRQLYRMRSGIERDFAHLCGFGGGLQPLPSWVRGPRRVVRWVLAKLIINGLRLCQIHGLAA
jgi:hypothetical protein